MSASTAILTLFASLPSDEQAETLKMLVDVLAGSSAPLGKKAPAKKTAAKSSAVASGKAKVSAPRAPTAWNLEVQAVREEYGVEGDEEGNPLMLPNGEYKYVMSWKDAMVEASARRAAAKASAAPNPFEEEEEAPAVLVPAKKVAAPAAAPKKPTALAAAAFKKPVAPAAAATKKVTAPAPEPEPELEFFTHADKEYLMAADGACWALEEDGSKGSWAGYFNILSEEFDTSRPDPSL